jgi:multiple antibiotic resistance protein
MEFQPTEIVLLLLATIGPLKVTLVCASLTAGASPELLKRIALRAVLVALSVCIVFALLGETLLKVFHVSIPAFQIGGGIVVMLFSIEMAMGKTSGEEGVERSVEPSMDLATYPLAVPLMASVSGLVAIVTLIAQLDNDPVKLLGLSGVIAAIMGLNYVCLRSSRIIVRALGPAALNVIGKIMGIILVALSVELIHMGLLGFGLAPRPL